MSKIKSLSEALDGIEDGATIGIGGWIFNSQPMALVRELIRRNKRNLRLVPAPGSIAPDMLIGAGCVAETGCVFISFEQFGLAPHFRRAAETGSIKIHELDGPAIAGGLRAAACDLPYGLIPDMCTDLPRVNPQTYQPVARALGERAMLKVPAIHLDVVLLHAAGRRTRQRAVFRPGVFRCADGAGGQEGDRLRRPHRADRDHPPR